MEVMTHLLAGIVTIPVFIPFAAFIIVYFFYSWKKKSKKDAMTFAVNVTTFFLITAVMLMHGLIKDDQSIAAVWWVLLFFLICGGSVSWLQYKIKGKIDTSKMVRAVWRLAFVFFTIAYFILFFSGINHFLQLT